MATLIGRRPARLMVVAGLIATLVAAGGLAGEGGPAHGASAAGGDEVSLLFGAPSSLDPAIQSDVASAAYSAQLYESLTAFDPSLTLRPALAGSWDVGDDGRQIVFHLRDGLEFSDGSPLGAEDVVGSWLRVIDPDRPSLLSSLLLDVHGAFEYVTGATSDPADVGIRAEGRDVVVDLDRPGADFPAIVASPTFGIVPPAVWRDGEDIDTGSSVGSGAYVLDRSTEDEYTLVANEHYWAGPPAISTVHLLTNIGGRSPVAAFEAGDVDYVGIGSYDASWIRFDADLGPQLRLVPSLSLTYVGFTTTAPPFDDERVRQAFGAAVDWTRLVELGASGGEVPAVSMVPPGIPGGGDRSWLPAHDPDRARELLADAGYPGGAGFPEVDVRGRGARRTPRASPPSSSASSGSRSVSRSTTTTSTACTTIRSRCGRSAGSPTTRDPTTSSASCWGRAARTTTARGRRRRSTPRSATRSRPATRTRRWPPTSGPWRRFATRCRSIPIANGDGWALSRDGLLGAGQNGLGILRIAGLAWQ